MNRQERSKAVVDIVAATEFGNFEESLQAAIAAHVPQLNDPQQADLYARIVTGQEQMKFKTYRGLAELVDFELRHTNGL